MQERPTSWPAPRGVMRTCDSAASSAGVSSSREAWRFAMIAAAAAVAVTGVKDQTLLALLPCHHAASATCQAQQARGRTPQGQSLQKHPYPLVPASVRSLLVLLSFLLEPA